MANKKKKGGSKISNTEWGLVIGAMLLIDLVEIGLVLLFNIGAFTNPFIDIMINLIWPTYLHLRGVDLKSTKTLITLILGAFLQEIPNIDGLWAIEAFVIMATIKAEEEIKKTTGVDIEGELAGEGGGSALEDNQSDDESQEQDEENPEGGDGEEGTENEGGAEGDGTQKENEGGGEEGGTEKENEGGGEKGAEEGQNEGTQEQEREKKEGDETSGENKRREGNENAEEMKKRQEEEDKKKGKGGGRNKSGGGGSGGGASNGGGSSGSGGNGGKLGGSKSNQNSRHGSAADKERLDKNEKFGALSNLLDLTGMGDSEK
ncbi:MAG: hypothetical protein EXS46_03020 [Candidatus Taylorbacteria bacterium]|nr:hypothetical protein [Candidatus Taylorbacteria bacterium]